MVIHIPFTPSCSTTLSTAGMAHAQTHAHRTGALPHLAGAREQYSTTTPSFRRGGSELLSRSPSFPGAPLRRHQLTTAQQGSLTGFIPAAARMDAGQYAARASSQPNQVPPLQPLQALGTLQYMDSTMAPIKLEINGAVDKGPFLSPDHEWTCYRRNYLACVCSFQLSPYYPTMAIQFTPSSSSGSSQSFPVYGFAMSISAVVAENEQQSIELVQHTPKRDKGPISKPSKVSMAPKTSSPAHHSLAGYGDVPTVPGARGLYPDGFTTPQAAGQALPSEHTFERIQFKQATQNNGKRRAAQQYYQLIVELWADVGVHDPDQFVKVAYRKSAKMIVRGRSPGHYQNERRGSQGNGPGGSAGTLGGYAPLGHMADFNSSAMLGGAGTGGYATTYDKFDARGNVYSGRQHEMPEDPMLTASDDAKAMDGSKAAYQYYPGTTMYDGHHHQHQHHHHHHHGHHADRVDIFNHRAGAEAVMPTMGPDGKVKNEYELNMLPRPFGATPRAMADPRQHDQFDGKTPSTGGYYPSILSPPGINMTMS